MHLEFFLEFYSHFHARAEQYNHKGAYLSKLNTAHIKTTWYFVVLVNTGHTGRIDILLVQLQGVVCSSLQGWAMWQPQGQAAGTLFPPGPTAYLTSGLGFDSAIKSHKGFYTWNISGYILGQPYRKVNFQAMFQSKTN